MKKRNFIFGCLGGLLFMAFTAVNVTVSQSYQSNIGMMKLSLAHLTAKADSGNEFKCADPEPPSICSSRPGTNCYVPMDPCHIN